jgi:site-specific recombinase XerC
MITEKMVYVMLEVDANNDWWEVMPETIQKDVETALIESENGELIPYEDIQKRYKKWISK